MMFLVDIVKNVFNVMRENKIDYFFRKFNLVVNFLVMFNLKIRKLIKLKLIFSTFLQLNMVKLQLLLMRCLERELEILWVIMVLEFFLNLQDQKIYFI